MKDIVLAAITALKANAGVAAVVGTRVYRKQLPTNPTFPAIVVSKVDDIRDSDSNTGRYGHARIQCTAFASTEIVADNLSELIADCLHKTVNTTMTAGTSTVYVVEIGDAGTVPDVNTEIPLFLYHRDFRILYSY
jgi:hypothetical protein